MTSTGGRRYAVRTYSRNKESPASLAFDEVVSKPVVKAAASKWGKTSFIAVRGTRKAQVVEKEVVPVKKKPRVEVVNQDPFSFDTEDRRKKSPAKPVNFNQSVNPLTTPAVARSVLKEQKTSGTNVTSRTLRVYSRNNKLKQEENNHQPVKVENYLSVSLSNKESDGADPELSDSNVDEHKVECVSPESLSEDEDPKFTFKSRPTKTYGRPFSTSASPAATFVEQEDESEQKPDTNSSPGLYSATKAQLGFNPNLLTRYGKLSMPPKKRDALEDFSNSTVVAKKELRKREGTTVIVVCKPKGSPDLSSTIQTKYFRGTKEMKTVPEETIFEDEIRQIDSDEDEAHSEDRNESPSGLPAIERMDSSGASRSEEDCENLEMPILEIAQDIDLSRTRQPATKSSSERRFFKSRNLSLSDKQSLDKQIDQENDETRNELTLNVSDSGEIKVDDSDNSCQLKTQLSDISSDVDYRLSQSDSVRSSDMDAESSLMDSEQSDSQSLHDTDSEMGALDEQKDGDSKSAAVSHKKERKFFKSKSNKRSTSATASDLQRRIFHSPKKSPTKHVYNARSWQKDIGEIEPDEDHPRHSHRSKNLDKKKKFPGFDEEEEKDIPTFTRQVHWPQKMYDEAYTSLKVNKAHKGLFTVVKNVKEAHEVQEYGETQEFMDDVEYLVNGLAEDQPISPRCLSCIQLAAKCIIPAFRMHLRAHGTISKIFNYLHDALNYPSLALCTALLMFVLSRDKLNMDLDGQSLNLMLRLLGVENKSDPELERWRQMVYEQCDQLGKERGPNSKEIDFENISTNNLALESLLSLTSKRAGEWFKEELRVQGGLDHIVEAVCKSLTFVENYPSDLSNKEEEKFKQVERCLKVLENITYMNQENSTYLISCQKASLVISSCRLVVVCQNCLAQYPVLCQDDLTNSKNGSAKPGVRVLYCLLSVLRVLLNLSHENEYGSSKIGEQENAVDIFVKCVLHTPNYVPAEQKFDILVLSLGLLINLIENCEVNRRRLVESTVVELVGGRTQSTSAIQALVKLFCDQEQAAKKLEMSEEQNTTTPNSSPNKSGEWKECDSGMQWVASSAKKSKPAESKSSEESTPESQTDEEVEFMQALHKAGKHMENSIVAAYAALLLGCFIQDNTIFVDQVKQYLPEENFDPLVNILKKFLKVMDLTTAVGNSSGGKSISRVIEILESC